MEKSFLKFLSSVNAYPDYIPVKKLEEMLSLDDIELLKQEQLLKRGCDLKECLCQSCHLPHFVEVKLSEKGPYIYCGMSDEGRNYISGEDLETWVFDVEEILKLLSAKLGVEWAADSTGLEGLWCFGVRRGTKRNLFYYYQGEAIEEVFDFFTNRPAEYFRHVVLTGRKIEGTYEGKNEVYFLDLPDFVSIKRKRLLFDRKYFDDYLKQVIRRVLFDRDNGRLEVNGKTVVQLKRSSPEYYFLLILYDNFDRPVSHKKICKYALDKLQRKEGNLNSDEHTKKWRNSIKTKAKLPDVVDDLIISQTIAPNENGYMMAKPEGD